VNSNSNDIIVTIKHAGQICSIYAGYGVLIASLVKAKMEFLLCGSLLTIIGAFVIYNWKQVSNARLIEIKRLLFLLPLIFAVQVIISLFKSQTQTSPYLIICVIGNFFNDLIFLFSLVKTKRYLEENINDNNQK